MLTPYFRDADTTSLNLTSRFAAKLNISDTALMLLPYLKDADTTSLNLTSRFAAKLNISDTASMLIPYFKDSDTTSLNLSSRFATKLNISDTTSMLTPYFRDADTTSLNLTSRFAAKLNISDTALMLLPYLKDADTTSLNLTSRFAAKLNISDTASMLTNYLRSGVAASTYLPLTGGTLTGGLTGTTALFSGNVAIGFPFAYKPFEVLSNANDFVSVGVRELGNYQWSGIHFGYREADVVYRKSAIVFQRNEAGPADASGKIHLLNVNSYEGGRNADLRDAKLTIGNNGFVGINDTSPSFNLDVTGTLNATGASLIGGTLGVTGATTLTGLLKNTSQRLTGNITISDFDANYNSVQTGPSSSATVNLALQQNISSSANISMGGAQGGGGEPFNPNIYFTDNRKAYASIGGIHTSSGTNNQSGHIVFNTTPSLNTIALTERMRIAQDGAITMGGTLGVTGATTLGSTLAVTGNITENDNNVLTNLDTASLSSRIDAINSGGNQIANNNNSTQTISDLSGLSNYYLWINNPNTVTITLPSPSANNNKMITIKNTGAGAVFSASSNVQPLANPTPPATLVNLNVILASGGGKWTTMVSNGFEWVKMAGN